MRFLTAVNSSAGCMHTLDHMYVRQFIQFLLRTLQTGSVRRYLAVQAYVHATHRSDPTRR